MRLRSFLLVGVMTATCAETVGAQTPHALQNIVLNNTVTEVANPWLGAQVMYKFGGTGEFGDNLLASARLLHDIELEQ